MLKPAQTPVQYAFDLLSLPFADWSDSETVPYICRLAQSLVEHDSGARVAFFAPQFMSSVLSNAATLDGERFSFHFFPLPLLLPPRIYFQQVALPVWMRWKGVNRVLSFGGESPAVYPAPKILALLPTQSREWIKLLPTLLTADIVTTESSCQKELWRERWPRGRAHVEVVPAAVSEEFHPYPKDAGRELFEKRGVKGRFALYLGARERAISGPMVALEAFAKVAHRPRMRALQWVYVGLGRVARMTVKARVEALNLPHRVRFVEELSFGEWPLWLSSAQFAVGSDRMGDISAILRLRAMASGCPVICPLVRKLDPLWEGSVLTCREGDPKSLAEAMTDLLADAELRDGLVREGMSLAQSKTWAQKAAAVSHLFETYPHSLQSPSRTIEVA